MALFDGFLNGAISSVFGTSKKEFETEADYLKMLEKSPYKEDVSRVTSDAVKDILKDNAIVNEARNTASNVEDAIRKAGDFESGNSSVGASQFQELLDRGNLTGEVKPKNNASDLAQLYNPDPEWVHPYAFLAEALKDGVASPNKYKVEFFLPRGLPEDSVETGIGSFNIPDSAKVQAITSQQNSSARVVSLMCSSAQFPGKSLLTVEHRHNNKQLKLPYLAEFEDVSFTLMCSEDMKERTFFESWSDTIYNVADGTLNFYDEYVGAIRVHHLDKNGKTKYTIDIYEAYPLSINAQEFSYGSQNEIQTLTVTFNYRYWKKAG